MQHLHRIALIFVGAILALAAAVLIGVNLYVQSQGAQAKIQQELSRRLGVSLKIRSMSVTPWGGLELSGITIPQTSSIAPKNFLEAKTFRLRVRFLSLFSQRLVIKEVSLIKPRIVWPQDAQGKWRLPGSEQLRSPRASAEQHPASAASETPTPVVQQQQQEEAEPSTTDTPINPTSPAKVALDNRSQRQQQRLAVAPEVRRVSIKDGNFTFLDRTGNLLASFTGVDFHTGLRPGTREALHGDTKIEKISLRDRFFLEQLRSPLRYEPDVLELSKISARVANGEINGYFAMQPEAEDSPFTTSIKFHDVLAEHIVENAGGPKGMVKGKLEGDFQASGKTGDPDALVGTGEIFLRDGRVQQYSLLVLLGQLLQIEELKELQLEKAEAKYHLGPEFVTIDELVLHSPNIQLTASGTVAFDRRLQLHSQLAINDRIRAQLFKAIRQNFRPTGEPGYSAVEFEVGGTIDRPSTNLMDQLVGRDLSSMLNTFFGGRKDKPKKKNKVPEQPMQAVPSPATSPEQSPLEATATPTPVVSP